MSKTVKEALPASVLDSLKAQQQDESEIRIGVCTDINLAGSYDQQWLIVTDTDVFVFDAVTAPTPVLRFPLRSIQEVRSTNAVGSGLMQIRVDGIWIVVVRYSNRMKFRFEKAVGQIRDLLRGEPLDTTASDHDPLRCPQCGFMLESSGELCLRCSKRGSALATIKHFIEPYWKVTVLIVVLMTFGIGLDLAWPLLTKYLVDDVLAQPAANRPPLLPILDGYSPHQLLLIVVVTLATVHILRAIVNLISGYVSSHASNAITFDIRARLVDKLQQLSLAYYSKQDTGSLVGRVAYDTEAVQSFITQLTNGFVVQFFLVILSFAMMAALEPSLALWATVPAPFILLGAVAYWRYVHPRFQRFWHRSSEQASVLNSILTGIRVVKAFAQEQNEYRRYQLTSDSVRKSKEKLDRTSSYFYPMMAIVFQAGGWIIWYVGGNNVLGHEMTLGTLMAFFGYLGMFYAPLGSLTNLTTWFTQFSTQMHRIAEILDTPSVLPAAENPVPANNIQGRIEFHDVTFGYARGTPVLKNLNFTIEPEQRVGIVGRSGSGKTSIVNLLCRFYDTDAGCVKLDGVDIRNFELHELRRQMAVVLQEPFLFRGTLMDNLKYGQPHAKTESVLEVTHTANAHDLIMKRPLAYDSSVGERGAEVSGGERQRISIARALLCPTPILILDEATASIDSESELSIQRALEDNSKRRSTVIIAHRLSTVRSCDKILVVEGGSIAESGSHDELMRLQGRYAHWVQIQSGHSKIKPEEDEQLEQTLPPPERLRWLTPQHDFFDRGPNQELQFLSAMGKSYSGIFGLRCFPVHHPEEYISIRYFDDSGRESEIGIIRDLNQWPPKDQRLVREALDQRYFFHRVDRIRAIREFANFLICTVVTGEGKMEFILRYTPESVQDFGTTGKIFIDVEENFYLIPDIAALPRMDRQLFNRFIYWSANLTR